MWTRILNLGPKPILKIKSNESKPKSTMNSGFVQIEKGTGLKKKKKRTLAVKYNGKKTIPFMAVTAWKSWLPKEQTLFPEIDYLGKL